MASSPAHAAALYLQRAPLDDVLAASMAIPDWMSLEAQGELIRAGMAAPAVGGRYRRRVLKMLMYALGKHTEVHEDLLAAYIDSLAESESEASTADLSFKLPGLEELLTVSVVNHIGGGSETGGMVWPASLLLASWLLRPAAAAELDGVHILELGSGVGMLGLALARCTPIAGITMTDFVVETLDNLQRNVWRQNDGVAHKVRVRQLDWNEAECMRRASYGTAFRGGGRDGDGSSDALDGIGQEGWRGAASPSVSGFDLVLAADVVYDPSALPALVATIAAALAPSNVSPGARRCRALVASERRSEETWTTFDTLLQRHRLQIRDLSVEARAACAAQSSFYCPSSTLERMVLIELIDDSLGMSSSEDSETWESRLCPLVTDLKCKSQY